jgi:hypothetical protein
LLFLFKFILYVVVGVFLVYVVMMSDLAFGMSPLSESNR